MAASDRMESYSIASMLNGGDRSVLDGWLRLDLDTTDFIAAPHGVMGRLQHQGGQSLPVVHDPMDYFCQPTLITKFCEFMHILACASGLAATSSEGYTFITLGDWYNSHLERAHRCPDVNAVRVWLERSVRGFKSALMAIKMRLRAILYSPTVERPFDTFVLSFDAECFSELRSAEVTQESLADRLVEEERYLGSTSGAPALQSMTLPLLSSLVRPPAKPKGPATKRQELAEGTSPTPATPAAKAPSKPKSPMTKRPKLGETTTPATSVTELTHSNTATIDESGERLMGMAASDAGRTTPLSSAAVPPAPDPSTLPYCNCHRRCFNRIWPQDRSPLCDFCYDGCDDCECAGEALGPQGQPCCVRPLEAATVCGECTSEVMPVTRTLGQMAVAVQAPAVEPMMMVIELSPFPEPVADTPGAHPPEVVPPEPVPMEAPLFEEHLIFHESLDMPANVGPRLADALAPSLRGQLESAVVTLMVAGVGGDVPDLLDIKSASVRRARASLRKHSVIVDEWEAPKIKAAAWLAQYVAPPHESTSVRHMADNPLRRHAFGLLRHHMLVLADARDAHDSFGNYEMFISGISDVAEIFEDIVLGARVVYDDNGADGDDADHSGVMLEPFVPASLAMLVPLRPSEDTVAGLALDPTPTEPTAEPTPPAPSLPASPPASETDNDEEVEDIEEVEVELGEALGPQGQPRCVRPLEAATACGECTSEVMPVTPTLGQIAVAVQAPAVEPMMMVIESSPFPEPVADTPGAHPPEVVPPEPVPLEAPLFEEHLIFHESLDMPANIGPRLADALAPSLRGKLESAVVTLMVAGVGGDVPDLLDIKSASVRRARASLRKHSVVVDEWEAPKIKAAAWLAQYVAPPHESTSVRHMADNPLRRHAFGLLRHHMLVLADARDAHDSFGNYEMFISGISDVAEIFEDIVLGARVVYDDNGADGDDADHSGVMLEPFVPASLAVLVPLRPSEDTVAGLALDPTPTEPTAEPTPPAPSLPASPPASETDNDEEVEDIEEVEVELEFEEENLVLEVVVDAWAPCTPTSPPAPGLSTVASSTAVASPSASSPRSAGGTLGERACASLDWAGSGPAPRGLEVIYLAAGTSRLITARDPELGGGDWGGTYNVHVSPPKAETGWGSNYEVRITSERRHPRGQDEPTLLISWLSAWGRPLSSKLPAITTIEASARNTFGVETQRLSHGEIIAYGTPNGYWSGSTLLTPHLATTRLYWAFRLNVRSEPPLVPGPPGWPRRPPQSTPGNSEPGRRRQSSSLLFDASSCTAEQVEWARRFIASPSPAGEATAGGDE